MPRDSLEVMARLTSNPIQVKNIVSSWLLITYDIPKSEKGDKARREFLTQARSLGAVQHTDSVYLMPFTPEAEILALQLARNGDVFVWTSQATDQTKAEEITKTYDTGLVPLIEIISKRIIRIQQNLADNHESEMSSEVEAGWYEVPEFDKYINQVSTSWMVHRLQKEGVSGEPFWENVEEPGKGHIPVWIMQAQKLEIGR